MNKTNIGLMAIAALVVVAGAFTLSFEQSADGQGNHDMGMEVLVYKSPGCGCCEGYVDALRNHGFNVQVRELSDLDSIKKNYDIPDDMLSCHTAIFGDYFVEGHVPIEAVEKLLDEKPAIDGIALPGMPAGSPGMPGTKTGQFEIFAIKDGQVSEYMRI